MTTHYSGLINQLVDQAKAMFKETDPANGTQSNNLLQFLPIKLFNILQSTTILKNTYTQSKTALTGKTFHYDSVLPFYVCGSTIQIFYLVSAAYM